MVGGSRSRPRWTAWRAVAVVALVALAVEAQEDEANRRRRKSGKVLGIGIGVFLLIFFAAISCIVCWSGNLMPPETHQQWIFNLVGTVVFGLVLAILLFADSKPKYETTEKEVKGYEDNLIGLVVVVIMVAIATGFGLGAVLCYHVCQPIEAASIKSADYQIRSRAGVFDSRGNCIGKQPTMSV